MTVGQEDRFVVLNTDLYDEVVTRKEKGGLFEEDVEKLVKDASEHGVKIINLRTIGIDIDNLRHSWLIPLDVKEISSLQGFTEEKAQDYIKVQGSAGEALKKTLERFDPLESFVRNAKKYDVRIYAWIDIYDHWIPGKIESYLAQHSEVRWTARDGRRLSVYSYASEEARQRRLREVKYFLEKGFEGIHLSLSCHARHYQPRTNERDLYGFEKPVVEECVRRGTNPTTDPFDRKVWQEVKGDFVVELYKGARRLCDEFHAALSLGIGFGNETIFPSPYWSGRVLASYDNRWDRIFDEVKPDLIVLGEYEPVLNDIVRHPRYTVGSASPYWAAKGVAIDENERLREYSQFIVQKRAAHPEIKWALHCNYLPTSRAEQTRVLRDWLNVAKRASVDAVYIHEAYSFEQPDTGFEILSGTIKETEFSKIGK